MRTETLVLRQRAERPVSFFEFWPAWLFYAPVVAQWIALGLRHGDMSLPTAANPHIELGGLCGESKTLILDQVAARERHVLAPYTRITTQDAFVAERAMDAAGLTYPVIVKPDIGCNGAGVKLVASQSALASSLAEFPPGAPLMLQRYAPEEGEAGLFYVRIPGEAQGRISSVTLKYAPYVVGDGRSTLRELVLADSRAGRVPHLYLPRLGERLSEIPPAGARVRLVFVGNHCRGSIFADGRDEITDALTDRIDAIARAMPEFYFGRIDVRFRSLAALRRGEDFTVIEINGVGSEATHIWDRRTTLWRAWADQFAHYGAAFRIGQANRARGYKPSGMAAMLRNWRTQRWLMSIYPMND
jgi:hypothetical protein